MKISKIVITILNTIIIVCLIFYLLCILLFLFFSLVGIFFIKNAGTYKNIHSLIELILLVPLFIYGIIVFFKNSKNKYNYNLILFFVVWLETQIYRFFFINKFNLEMVDFENLLIFGIPFIFIGITKYLAKFQTVEKREEGGLFTSKQIAVGIGFILIFIILPLFFVPNGRESLNFIYDYFSFIGLIIGFIFIIIYFRRDYKRNRVRNRKILKSFAGIFNLVFLDNPQITPQQNYFLLNVGSRRQICNLLKGNYQEREIKIYSYEHHFTSPETVTNPMGAIFYSIIAKEPNDIRYNYTVLEIKSTNKFPPSLVASRKALDLGILPIGSYYSGRLGTESNDFDKNFKIYLQKLGNQEKITMLQVLTPDVMDFLLTKNTENNKKIMIEINNDSILLYKSGFLRNTGELQELLNSFLRLVNMIEDNFNKIPNHVD